MLTLARKDPGRLSVELKENALVSDLVLGEL